MSQENVAQKQVSKDQRQKFLSFPRTRLGKWSAGLAATFLVLFLLNSVLFVSGLVRLPMQETWGPFYALLMVGCGLAAGIVGLTAVLRQRERSWAVWLAILPGLFMLTLLLGEFLVPH
jgi:hypothetical protein